MLELSHASARYSVVLPRGASVWLPVLKQVVEKAESVLAFEERVSFERACSARGDHPISMISAEVEDDGAAAGTEWLTRSLRSTDVICRVGPRKFGILLPATSPEDARRVSSLVLGATTGSGKPTCEIIDLSEPRDARWGEALPADREPRPSGSEAAENAPEVVLETEQIFALLSRPLTRRRRVLDILVSGSGIVVLTPLLVAIAIAIKLTSRGPLIFKQLRTGTNLRRFRIYKFRTMRAGADQERADLAHLNEMSGPLFKCDADPRLTPIGGFLRRWSLDEIPQLVNVLKGDMTFLGPRALSPPPSSYASWQLRRFTATPGVACTWQASRRGEVDFDEWMRSDLEYVDRGSSFGADLRLLLRILSSLIKGSGAR